MAYNPMNPNGQATSANSSPVVIASNQSNIPTTENGTIFAFSPLGINSTTTNLAAGATFAGTVESIVNQQSISVISFCNQTTTVVIYMYIDAAGTEIAQQLTYNVAASTGFSRSLAANGNYCKVSIQNTGGSTSTVLELNVAYGTIPSATQLGNNPSAINEINGVIVDSNSGSKTNGTQRVVIATDDVNLSAINSKTVQGQGAASTAQLVTFANENINDLYVTGQSAQTVIVNNILTATAGTSATDIQAYRSFCVQVVSTATAGTFIFEGSNDNTNFQSIPVFNQALIVVLPIVTAITASVSQIIYSGACNFRYIRLRIVTTITGGSIQAFSTFTQTPFAATTQLVTNGTATNLLATVSGALTTVSTVTAVTAANLAIPNQTIDVASAALTTTTTTAAITPNFGTSYNVNIIVGVVSGTTPTMDVNIEESDDAGTNWFTVYSFPRITVAGAYRSPKMPLTGNRVRYVQTVGGTTPSFTRAVNRLQCSDSVFAFRQLIDRSIVLTTLSSVTPALTMGGAKNVTLAINIGTATTPPAIQLQGSDDFGTTYYNLGSPLTAVASSTVSVTVTNVSPQTLRAIVTTIGNTVVAGYVLIKGF